MKILHFDFDDLKNPEGGGQAVRTFEVNRRLAKRHQIVVVTGNYPGAKNETIENIKYLRVGLKKFPGNFLSYSLLIPEIVKRVSHDLVVENFTPPFGPALTPLFTKKPVIAMVDWGFAREMSNKYKLPFFIWQDIGVKYYKNFIFPTEAIKDHLLGSKKRPGNFLISTDMMLEDFQISKARIRADEYLLFMGRLDWHQKGIDLLLRAYKIFLESIDAPLYIVGEGRDKKKIQKIIKGLGLEKKVILCGKIEGQKKEKLFAEARLICIPSRYESGCLVALESLLFKKTMVCFDLPVMKEITQNQAVFAKPFDYRDFAKKLIFGYKNSAKISRSMKYKTFPTWEEIAKDQEDFCLKIISSAAPHKVFFEH